MVTLVETTHVNMSSNPDYKDAWPHENCEGGMQRPASQAEGSYPGEKEQELKWSYRQKLMKNHSPADASSVAGSRSRSLFLDWS